MSASDDRVTGVVLSGGGAYAAYEVGVMKALIAGVSTATARRPLDPMVLSGTSGGAFNVAALVSWSESSPCAGIAALEDIWRNRIADRNCGNGVYRNLLDWDMWLNPACAGPSGLRSAAQLSSELLLRSAAFWSAPRESLTRRLLRVLNVAAFLRLDPFERLIREVVDPEVLQRSARTTLIAVTNSTTGELFTFTNPDMTEAQFVPIIMASAAIPGLFPPVRIGGNVYVDGGVLMNTPLRPAVLAGANYLQVIYLDPDLSAMEVELDSTIGVLDRALMLARADIIERDIAMISRVNHALEMAETSERRVSDRTQPGFFATHDREGRPLRRITVHCHRPSRDLGGLIGSLDVAEERIDRLIRLGEEDAINHRCDRAGCITAAGKWGADPLPS